MRTGTTGVSIGDEVRFAPSPIMVEDKQDSGRTQEPTAYHPDYTTTRTPRERKLRMKVNISKQGLPELDLSEYDLQEIPHEVYNFTRLESLNISKNRISIIPTSLSHLRKLRILNAHTNRIVSIPNTLSNCIHLQEVNLSSNRLVQFPRLLGNLHSLKILKLAHNQFDSLPREIGDLEQLRHLDLSYNKLWHLPFSFTNLSHLQKLNLSGNAFDQLPICVCSMKALETFDFSGNKIINVPTDFGNLQYLKELNLAWNRLETVPYAVSNLKMLQSLDLSYNSLKTIPARLTRLTMLKTLIAQGNTVGSIPNHMESIEFMNLASNKLRNLSVSRMKHLRYLNVNNNQLENLPLGVCNLSHLEVLKLNQNKISYVSQDIVLLKKLRTLDLGNNKLTSLPNVINELENLESFNIKGNRLEQRIPQHDSKPSHRGARHRSRKRIGSSHQQSSRHSAPHQSEGTFQTDIDTDFETINYDDRGRLERKSSRRYQPSKHHRNKRVTASIFKRRRRKSRATQHTAHSRQTGTQYTPKSSVKARERPPLDYQPKSNSLPNFYKKPNIAAEKGYSTDLHVSRPSSPEALPSAPSPLLGTLADDIDLQMPNEHVSATIPESKSLVASSYPPTTAAEVHMANDTDNADANSYTRDWIAGRKKPVPASMRSNAATVNDSVGDDLSLGEEDFDFQPTNVKDTRLLGMCNEIEALLNKQLMHPITNKGIFRKSMMLEGKPTTPSMPFYDESAISHSGGMTSHLPTATTPTVSERHRDIFMLRPLGNVQSNLLQRTKTDVFKVTPAGGLFKSSVDPNITLYFPVKAVDEPLIVLMQIEKIERDILEDAKQSDSIISNIIAMGDIVHITKETEMAFNEQVTLTIPEPPGDHHGKLHVVTYNDDHTCSPCTSSYKSYHGYVSLQAWHFSGKGTVITKSSSRTKASKSVENLLQHFIV